MNNILEKQRTFFMTGQTLDIEFRISYLKKLANEIKKRENDILNALYKDLGKSETEAYMCELGLTLSEISYFLKNLKTFAKEKTVPTPLTNFMSRSYIKFVPRGNVLIISPWNYPFLLSVEPLVDAIAAGNTVILKPSAYSPYTSDVIFEIINSVFEDEYVKVVKGGREENKNLLNLNFDFVFFTGSQNVGKEVLRSCSENLTPSVLELGGKSPCIVDKTANIKLAAKRIVFGKFLNCGQTCVAPDYIYCDKSVKEELISELIAQIDKQYGNKPILNKDYGKIINKKHFERLINLIDQNRVIKGGNTSEETLKIEPTIMAPVTWNDKVMQEEIFGPVLPILEYDNLNDVIKEINNHANPLALYIFSNNKKNIKSVTDLCRYGGGCINDVVVHLATSEMPFGGFKESGMGAYHGKYGFETFSHQKSMLDKKVWIDLPIRYQPYNAFCMKLLKIFLK
ncbi:aldehyde dehydrogenase [bacterium]|nr:aldehyde dehydrogenase [bacterium]